MQQIDYIDDIADGVLFAADSKSRGGVLVEILQSLQSPAMKNKLLQKYFPHCEALRPWTDDLRREFRLAGFVTDTEEPLHLPVKVYRAAWSDDDPHSALSWTTDIEVAKRFAQMCNSPRGKYLGMYRADRPMRVYTGICTEALGYLTARGEAEVIAGKVESVKAIPVSWTDA